MSGSPPANVETTLSIRGISKRFGNRLALDHLELEVRQGELFGLLGHNGAGKSTTIGIMLGQVNPDSGRVEIHGADVAKDRQGALNQVGAIFETPSFYEYLSGWRNLRLFADYTGGVSSRDLDEAIDLVGLTKRIHDPVRAYSHGMRQRLALAQAMLPRPRLLILDEPSEGLDPEGIHAMRDMIRQLNQEHGITIFLCSHLLSEVQLLCSRLAILRQGQLLFCGEWQEFSLKDREFRLETDDNVQARVHLREAQLIEDEPEEAVPETTDRWVLREGRDLADVAELLVNRGRRLHALAPLEQTLEDFYLQTIQSNGNGASSAKH